MEIKLACELVSLEAQSVIDLIWQKEVCNNLIPKIRLLTFLGLHFKTKQDFHFGLYEYTTIKVAFCDKLQRCKDCS